jgi:23S rRNA (adenine2503-C2)-methyltransferase
MGLLANLSIEEILDQVVQAGQIAGAESRRIRNLVFMGMGEPLQNEDNLYAALQQLTAPKLFGFAPQRLVVSTVGIPCAMLRLAARFPQVRLAVSLHSARQAAREQIIPLARRYPLGELQDTIVEINARSTGRVMLEYLMLHGLTDRDEDLFALVNFATPLRIHINLIPLNSIERPAGAVGPDLVASSRTRIVDFATKLRGFGFKVTVRYSLGRDVAAACGQLVQREQSKAVRGFRALGPNEPMAASATA